MKNLATRIVLSLMVLAGGLLAAPQNQAETPAPAIEKTGFFIRGQLGLDLFLNQTLEIEKTFTLYAETATLAETYSFSNVLALELGVGGYLRLGGTRLKAGLGLTKVLRSDEAAYTARLPHPFLSNTPRTVDFESAAPENATTYVYAFGLFSLVRSEKLNIWAGPVLGLGFSTFNTLADFEINEQSPYGSADVTISNISEVEDSWTSILFGGAVDVEYAVGKNLELVFSAKLMYDNPKVPNLGQRANWLQGQFSLGVQYRFNF